MNLLKLIQVLLPGNSLTPGYTSAVLSGYGLVGANIVIQVLLVPLYLSSLGKAEFGFLMFVLSLVNFAAFGIGWLTGGSIRVLGEFYARNDGDGFQKAFQWMRKALWAYSALLGLAFIILGVLPESLLVKRFSEIPADTVQATVLLTTLYLIAYYDFTAIRQALTAIGRQAVANYATIASIVVFCVLVVPWLLWFDGGLPGVVCGLLLGVLVARLWIGFYARKIGPKVSAESTAYDASTVRSFFLGKTGAAFAAYGALLLVLQADVMIVGWLGGASMAAEFVLVWKVAEMAALMLWRIPGALHPYIVHLDVENDYKTLESLYRSALFRMLGFGLVASIFYAIAGPYIVSLWVGADQAPDSQLAYVLAASSMFFLIVARVPSIFAYARTDLNRLLLVLGAEVVLKLVGTVLLFPHVGYLAPFIAFTVVHILGIAYIYQAIGWPTKKRRLKDELRGSA